jgi:hypothetical protein
VQPKDTSTLLVFQVAGATRGQAAGSYGYAYGCGCPDNVVNSSDFIAGRAGFVRPFQHFE